ncbi:MAG: insulinase family protein [Myxococcaceae bacterium]
MAGREARALGRGCSARAVPSGLGFWTALLLASGAIAGPASAVHIGESPDKLGTINLPSGMRIVIEEDHSKPVVAVVTVVNAGAADDPVGKEGLAHLVEHLTSRAKPDGKTQRASQLDFAGAASWNGSTTHDLTTFGVVGPKEALRNLLVIEGGRLSGPLAGLDERVFETEREIVRAELAGRDEQGSPGGVEARLYDGIYPEGHRYYRPVLGSAKSLAQLSLADAQAFVEKYYVPINVTLYVAGDVELSTIHQVFGATLPKRFVEAPDSGPVKPPVRLSPEAPPVPPVPTWQPVATIRAPVAGPMLYVMWSLPRGYSLDGTLERAVRSALEAVPMWVSRSSDIADVRTTLVAGRDASTLVCAVALKEGRNPEKSLERVLDQFHRFSDTELVSGPANGEAEASRLDNALGGGVGRTLAAASTIRVGATNDTGSSSLSTQTRNSPTSAASSDVQVARYQMTALVQDVVETESVLARAKDRATLAHWTGDSSGWSKDMTALTEVGPSTWQNFTLQWLSRDRARVLFVEPNGESIEASEDGGPPSVFAADDVHVKVSSGALKTYAHGPVGDIRSFTLKNGLQVLLVRRLGAPTVAATLGVKGGSATAEPLGVAALATRLAVPLQNGNGPPSQFGGTVAFFNALDVTYLEGRAASGNLADLLAVLSDTIQSLHVDDGLGWNWNELVDARHSFDLSASAETDRRFLAEVLPGSAGGRTAQAEDFKKLGTGDVNRWIEQTFRPNNAVLAVVGDINVAEAEASVHEWFEGWKGQRDGRGEAPAGKLRERKGAVHVVTVDRPGAERTEIRIGCGIEAQSPTDLLAMRILGARLRTKLGTLARSTLGGSDGFSGGAMLQRGTARVDVAGTVDARALNPVLVAARQELAALDDLKLTEDELALLRWRQAMGWNTRLTTNAALAQGLIWTRLADLPVELLQKYAEQLAAVTPEDVNRVAAACRKTAVLLVSGDPGVVDKALFVTEGMVLRKGS